MTITTAPENIGYFRGTVDRSGRKWSIKEHIICKRLWWQGKSPEHIAMMIPGRTPRGVINHVQTKRVRRSPEALHEQQSAAGRVAAARESEKAIQFDRMLAGAIRTLCEAGPLSKTTLASGLNGLHVFTPSGTPWSVDHAQRCLQRLRQRGLLEGVPRLTSEQKFSTVKERQTFRASKWPEDAPHYTDMDDATLARERARSPGLWVGFSKAPNLQARAV